MVNFTAKDLNDGAKVLTDAMGRRILLYKNDEPQKIDVDLAIRYPAEKVIASSPIDLAFAMRLNEAVPVMDRFVGIVNVQEAHLVLPELVNRYRSGALKNVEHLQDFKRIKHDLIFTFAFPHDSPSLAGALERLKLPYAAIDAWYESDFGERIKWMEFMAYFFGAEDKARGIIDDISKELRKTAVEMRSEGQRVLWFADFQDYPFVTGGNSWVAQAIRRLGSDVITPDPGSPGSVDTPREWVASEMRRADVMVFTMVRPSIQHIQSMYPRISESPAYRNDRIFGFNVNYWQEGTFAPERWFRELAMVLKPDGPGSSELTLFAHVRTG